MGEIILKSEVIVDGQELTNKIISVETIKTLFSLLDTNVFIYLIDNTYHIKDSTIINNIGQSLFSIISFYNPHYKQTKFDTYLPGFNPQTNQEDIDKDEIVNTINQSIPILTKVLDAENNVNNIEYILF